MQIKESKISRKIVLVGFFTLFFIVLFFCFENVFPLTKDLLGRKENYRFIISVLTILAYMYYIGDINKTGLTKATYTGLFFTCIGIGFGALILYFFDLFVPFLTGPFWTLGALFHINIYLGSVAVLLLIYSLKLLLQKRLPTNSEKTISVKKRLYRYLMMGITSVYLLGCLILLYYKMFFDGYPSYRPFLCVFITTIYWGIYVYEIFKGKEIFYLTIPYRKYLFFLRSFNDDNILKIDHILSKYFKYIIEIGNPSTENGNLKFAGHTFFLPSSEWKKEVSYYIYRAEYIFCCIANTEGIKWEIEKHITNYQKFIFYVMDMSTIRPLMNILDNKSPIRFVISKLVQIVPAGHCTFIINGNKVYYSKNVQSILECVSHNKNWNELLYFTMEEDVIIPTATRTHNVYCFMDALRIFWRIFRPRQIVRLSFFHGISLLGIMCVAGIIVSVSLIVFGVVNLFTIFNDNSDAAEVLIQSWVTIIIGVSLLKELKD